MNATPTRPDIDTTTIEHLDFDPCCEARNVVMIRFTNTVVSETQCTRPAEYVVNAHPCPCGHPQRTILICQPCWNEAGGPGGVICTGCSQMRTRDQAWTILQTLRGGVA
jgi:hypothetical protein